jgi:hypothetical protein
VDIINNETNRFLLKDYMMNYVVIHELGHGCKIPHHGSAPGQEGTGNPECVIKYYDIREQAETFTFYMLQFFDITGPGSEELPVMVYRNWIFCRDPDNCWSKLTINDRMP